MFFIIAGIQPKTVDLEDRPRMCPSCGLFTARMKRTDHYLSVFFLPLFRVKEGNPFLGCGSCGHLSTESGETAYEAAGKAGATCPACGGSLDGSFKFCPHCGKRLP